MGWLAYKTGLILKSMDLGKKHLLTRKQVPIKQLKKPAKNGLMYVVLGRFLLTRAIKKGKGVSIPIRGPVTIHSAFSVEPVTVTSTQITKSVSGEGDGEKKASDTMGMKHRVDKAIYYTVGAINTPVGRAYQV